MSPVSNGPTIAEANVVHLAWDVMVGLGTLLALLSVWYGLSWLIKRDYPKTKWFLRIAACTGVLAVITMEAGWVVTEVGRQPWIVHNYMKVDAGRDDEHGRLAHVPRSCSRSTRCVGVTTILVLRGMSRRWREAGDVDESDVPYGPSDPGILGGDTPRGGAGRMNLANATAVVLFFGVTAYALFGGADFGAGFWDLIAGGAERGERPRALIDHSIGPVWEANHVWLIFCLVVLWTAFSEAFASITLTLFVPLTLAALGIVLRGSSFAFRKAVLRTRDRRNFGAAFALVVGARAVLHGRGRGRDRVRTGPVGREGRRPVVELDQPHVDHRRPARDRGVRVPLRGVPRVGRAPARRSRARRVLPAPGDRRCRSSPASIAFVGIFVFHSDAHYLFDGLTSRALPLVIVSGSVRRRARSCCCCATRPRWARLLSIGAVATVVIGWGVAQWPYMLPESLKVSQAAAPTGTLDAVLVVFVVRGGRHPAGARAALHARPEEPARRRRRQRHFGAAYGMSW